MFCKTESIIVLWSARLMIEKQKVISINLYWIVIQEEINLIKLPFNFLSLKGNFFKFILDRNLKGFKFN